jgi:uncharacterized Zn-binding protein involved in type VI secretion
MPKAARITDRHKAVATPTDYVTLLQDHDDETATEKVLSGSHNVFINGQPAARLGDEREAGATFIATGCPTVFINSPDHRSDLSRNHAGHGFPQRLHRCPHRTLAKPGRDRQEHRKRLRRVSGP